MKLEQSVEPKPVRKTIWIKMAIALLALMSIGQISAMFLPALTGVSPKPISMIGSILWLSFLFMFIWSLKSKKKLYGFVLGALLGLILHFCAGVTASYINAKKHSSNQTVTLNNKSIELK